MIVMMGYIHVEPSDVTEFLVDMETIAAGTRAEPGCLFYAVALEDAPTGRMLLAQRWQSEEAVAAHMAGPHAASFQHEWATRVRLDLQRYDVDSKALS